MHAPTSHSPTPSSNPTASANPTVSNGNTSPPSNPPSNSIRTATVIGAGTMGAAIAAHLANAGLRVFLLDMADSQADSQAEATHAADAEAARAARNQIVTAGFERMRTARPANLFTPQTAHQITLGNLDDDLETAARQSDWIIEAIVERLEPKQALMARLESCAPPHAIISTNTSGLPIREIVGACTPDFQRRFLGTHFFNPPRYLYLLELIPTAHTDPAIVAQLVPFATHTLGKGVVVCKDTPNFIANRMISFIISQLMEYAIDQGYTVEEVDMLAGPLIGRPRSGLFRLLDVIGIDVMAQINRNLYDLIPHDGDREALRAPLHTAVWQTLMEQGFLGSKRGQGFFKTVTDESGARAFWTLDLQAAARGEIHYNPPAPPNFPELEGVRRAPLAQRLSTAVADPGRGGALVRHTLYHSLVYAARRIPEMADSLADIDRVMRWGFLWEMGPFEMWDALGVPETAQAMHNAGMEVPAWVEQMLAAGHTRFYRQTGSQTTVYDPATTAYVDLPGNKPRLEIADLRRPGRSTPPFANDSATLHRIPPQNKTDAPVLLLEFHSKLNALDAGSLDALEAARDALYASGTHADANAAGGLLIANAGIHFCVGANLQHMLAAARENRLDELAAFIRRGQYLFLDLRRAPKPIVAAPFQRVLGGGVEVCLAAHRVVAQAETYLGLVETSVGLIPGWGGCKELVRRHIDPKEDGSGLDALGSIFETIAFAQVSTSAAHAKSLGLLAPDDPIAMNPELLADTAYEQLQNHIAQQATGDTPQQLYAVGKPGLESLQGQIEALHAQQKLSDYDRHICERLAYVLCGGDGAAGWQPEETLLELEREAFVALAAQPQTQARMEHMLRTGKPLRN